MVNEKVETYKYEKFKSTHLDTTVYQFCSPELEIQESQLSDDFQLPGGFKQKWFSLLCSIQTPPRAHLPHEYKSVIL